MGPVILIGLVGWILWLWRQDSREQSQNSGGVNLVVVWAIIYGSRPITSWFNSDQSMPEARDQGNPVEATITISLILVGLAVLGRRRINLQRLAASNQLLTLFYLFWLASALWSDYPLITVKRLVKDLGNVVMVLLVLSERYPGVAIRTVLTRCAYVCLPMSIWLIRYYPSVGRNYVGYDLSELSLVGVTENKNALGALAMVSVLFVLWDVLERRGIRGHDLRHRCASLSRLCVLAMGWYLLLTIDSVTSLICALGGSALLLLLSFSRGRRTCRGAEAVAVAIAGLSLLVDWVSGLREAVIEALGRDLTLTSRTDIWPALLPYQDSAIVGAGFDTFWAGHRLRLLFDRVGGIIQAHNGYLETYLNGGWMGVSLLVSVLLIGYIAARRAMMRGVYDAPIRLTVLVVATAYNLAEASFNKMGVLWLVTLWSLLRYENDRGKSRTDDGEGEPLRAVALVRLRGA